MKTNRCELLFPIDYSVCCDTYNTDSNGIGWFIRTIYTVKIINNQIVVDCTAKKELGE